MPKPTKGARLGKSPAHEKLIIANIARSVIQHGRVTTTLTRAKRTQPVLEKLITKGKKGDLHNVRQVVSVIKDKDVTKYLFDVVAPKFEGREGGYSRIVKIGNRKGDNAEMVVFELVTEPVSNKPSNKSSKPAKEAKESPVKEAPAEEEVAEEEIATEEVVEETPVEAVEETPAEADKADETVDEDNSETTDEK
ncbi:MAG: 50S ribosomal protein L17 [Bifidobacteriaceae bacterium]|jgi:large subunit ribosomal protein L17|nr:50S ribosomal protein L17 [Bifidobacteriaceae bacterium]